MNKTFLILLLLVFSAVTFATQQEYDVLVYNNQKLTLHTHWTHPSPLVLYYYQKNIKFPFRPNSTANYRGHIATWKIANNRLYLTDVNVSGVSHKPEEYEVRSSQAASTKNAEVWADWFSGMLLCFTEGYADEFYFRVRNGVILDSTALTLQDRIDSAADKGSLSEELREKFRVKSMLEAYQGYYYRLYKNDRIEYGQKTHLLITGPY